MIQFPAASVRSRRQPPYPTSNLVSLLDASVAASLTVDGSNRVSAWADQAASRSYTQGTGSNQPLYESSPTSWAKPAVYFDGSSVAKKIASNAAFASGQQTTLYMVLQEVTQVANDAQNSVILWGSSTGITSAESFSAEFATSGAFRYIYGNVYSSGITQMYGTPSLSISSGPRVLCWQFDMSQAGASAVVRLQEQNTDKSLSSINTLSVAGTPGSTTHTLGELNGYRSDIKVGALLEYSTLHGSTERSAVFSYLSGWIP